MSSISKRRTWSDAERKNIRRSLEGVFGVPMLTQDLSTKDRGVLFNIIEIEGTKKIFSNYGVTIKEMVDTVLTGEKSVRASVRRLIDAGYAVCINPTANRNVPRLYTASYYKDDIAEIKDRLCREI